MPNLTFTPGSAYPPLQTQLVDLRSGLVVRQWYQFYQQLQQLLQSSYLPVYNVLSYGATGNGTTQDVNGIQAAYNAAVANGGGTVYLPPVQAFYSITSPLSLTSSVPVTFVGSGASGILKRTANMPQNMGVVDVGGGQNITFNNLLVDGNVTTSTGLSYSELAPNYDPMSPLLATNSTFWIHDGSQNIQFWDVTIQHTGGYSIVAQAVNSNIENLYFFKVLLKNNRPHLFGLNPGDLNYGSWTGGILLHANGLSSTATVNNARFLSCRAERVTGNAFWVGHLYGFNTAFNGVTLDDISGLDCGRDLIQTGATIDCRINGVTGRRIGYITTDDTSPSVPKYEVGQFAVALDGGPCHGTVYGNINLSSVNGGFCDFDGQLNSTLSNFSFRIPMVGDPDYIEDSIGAAGYGGGPAGGPNFIYGINQSPAGYGPYFEGSHKVSAGNISNMGLNAIRLFGGHNSAYSDLRIYHPSVSNGPPISIGNLSPANLDRSYGNTISNLHMEWSPASPAACIQEAGGFAPFQTADINQYLMNQVISTTEATAVSTDPASGSFSSITKNIDFSSYTGILKVIDGSIVGS